MPPLVLDGTNGVSGVDGTASNPSLEGTDSNTGIFYPAADTVAIGTGGTEALRVNSSQNVGIGTTSPGYKLDARISGTSSGAVIQVGNTGSGGFGGLGVSDGGAYPVQIWGSALSFLTGSSIYGSATEKMRLDASGNLGLGVTPSAWGSGAGALQTVNNAFFTGFGNSAYVGQNAYRDGAGTWRYMTSAEAARIGTGNGGGFITFETAASGTAGNSVTWNERARITSGGNFCLGTTTEAGRAYILGDGTNVGLRVSANTATTTVYASIMRHESTTSGAYIQFVTDGNVETGRIYDSAGTMQYASSSDARLKTNVQPMQNSLQSVLALNPCTFDMRRGEDTFVPSAGLIAQEVHEIYPFVVGVGGDDENTNPWSVDYGKLTPLLVAAIKELNAKVEAQAAEIAALKGTA